MKTQDDRRVKRTKKILREALIEELQSTELRKISVKSLCDKADINRSTFYLHYDDVFDLWNSLIMEINDNMNKILGSFQIESILTRPLPLLLEITGYLESEPIFSRGLFQSRESAILLDRIKSSFIDYFLHNSGKIIKSEDLEELKLYITFVTSGAVSLFHRWFLGELDITLNNLAYRIERLITSGVEEYLKSSRIDR